MAVVGVKWWKGPPTPCRGRRTPSASPAWTGAPTPKKARQTLNIVLLMETYKWNARIQQEV